MAAGAQVVSRGRPHGKGANVTAAAEAALSAEPAPRPGPALRRRPRRLGGAAGAAGRGGRAGRVRPRGRRLLAPRRRRLRPRARLRPLGDPPPLRRRDRGADLRPAGDAGRGPARDPALRRRLRHGDRDDRRRRPRRLPAAASTSSTSSTGPPAARFAGFLHRGVQLRDFARVYLVAALAWVGDEGQADADRSAGDAIVAVCASAASLAQAELTARGDLFVRFSGGIAPNALPRHARAPISVSIAGTVRTLSGERPPALRGISIAINQRRPPRRPRPAGLPTRRDRTVLDRGSARPLRPGAGRRRHLRGRRRLPRTGGLSLARAHPRLQRRRRRQARDPRPRLRRRAVPITRIIVFHIRERAGTYGTVLTGSPAGGADPLGLPEAHQPQPAPRLRLPRPAPQLSQRRL